MDADQWWRTGRIDDFADRLSARGELPRMALVLPSSGDLPYTGVSEQHVLQELLPWLAQRHGLAPDRTQLAVAGMSMGARGALHLAQAHPQRFGAAYGLSGSFSPEEVQGILPWPAGTPVALRCGTEDEVFPQHLAMRDALRRAGVPVAATEEPGGHTWHYWSHTTADLLRWVGTHLAATH